MESQFIDSNNYLHAIEMEFYLSKNKESLLNFGLGNLAIVFIKQGQMVFEIENREHKVSGPAVIFLTINQKLLIKGFDGLFGFFLVMSKSVVLESLAILNKSYFISFSSNLVERPFFNLTESSHEKCSMLLSELSSAANQITIDRLYLKLIFTPFLYILLEEYEIKSKRLLKSNASDYNTLNLFVKKLDSDFVLHKDAMYYATSLDIPLKLLNEICKSYIGFSVKQFIDSRVNQEIIKKLAQNYSILEVCYELGFDDLSNFVKYFKRLNGVTPSVYKDMIMHDK